MPKIRFFLLLTGIVLAVQGAIISLNTAVDTIANPSPTLSPFDQSDDDVISPDDGFAPLLVPTQPIATDLKNREQPTPSAASSHGVAGFTPQVPALVWIPNRIVIPAIQLDAPIFPAEIKTIAYMGKNYPQWKVPNFFAAGWASTSASLGVVGNTVLFGHHNADGEVFAHLVDLKTDDLITVYSGEKEFTYLVVIKMILPERNQPVDIRLQNASWILPSTDERLTLLTCWPYTTNTHRLIIVAIPVNVGTLKNYPFKPRLTPLPTKP